MPLTDAGLTALKDEIDNDPAGRGYKNSDGTWKGAPTIRRLVNEELPQSPVQGDVPLGPIRELLVGKGALADLLAASDKVLRSAGEVLASGVGGPLSASNADALLQKGVDAGVISSEEKAALMAEGQSVPTKSRAETAIGPGADVTNEDVERARLI